MMRWWSNAIVIIIIIGTTIYNFIVFIVITSFMTVICRDGRWEWMVMHLRSIVVATTVAVVVVVVPWEIVLFHCDLWLLLTRSVVRTNGMGIGECSLLCFCFYFGQKAVCFWKLVLFELWRQNNIYFYLGVFDSWNNAFLFFEFFHFCDTKCTA